MILDAKVFNQYPTKYVRHYVNTCGITDFRVCEVHYIYRKKVIESTDEPELQEV